MGEGNITHCANTNLVLHLLSRGGFLRRLGRILHLSKTGSLILKTNGFTPKIGTAIVDYKRREIGRVFDIIGSVSSPYLVIKPSIPRPEKVVGLEVFSLPPPPKLKKRRKKGFRRK
ncbi:MAG TPA: H/ACA RNA-protein complex protein Gar1 [Candidatus Methanomethylia archaeon]|nr:H/ACA RNA-protein complex protein Gar1 [Candidatus Methanomethylicia archaeon]